MQPTTEEQFDITEGWIELSACCDTCRRIVSAKADRDRLDKFVALCDTVGYWGGPMFAAIDTWTESPHWYRELMCAAATDPDGHYYSKKYANAWEEGYYCDNCFNPNYLEGIDDSGSFKNYHRTKLFMELMEAERPGTTADWYWSVGDEATRIWRKELWDKAGDQVYGRR